jgi:hypothetical protein
VTRVRFGRSGFGVVVSPQQVEETQIRLLLQEGRNQLPPGSLRSGGTGLLVTHDLIFGTQDDPHGGFESNVATFVLRPSVSRDASGNYRIRAVSIQPDVNNTVQGIVAVTLRPKARRRQRVVLLLNAFGTVSGAPRAYSFDAIPRDADRYTIRFRIRKVVRGTYLVSVQTDDTESPLEVDRDQTSPTFERYIAPTITF